MEIDQIIKTLDEKAAIRTKNVIAGTSAMISADFISYDNKVGFRKQRNINLVPSLFTTVNEGLVNAVDHFISCINKQTIQHKMNSGTKQRYVDNINITMFSNGAIQIYNDGYGIPTIKKGDVYLPILLFTKERTGGNTEADEYRMTSGTNGYGTKVITSFSKITTIECQDDTNYFRVDIITGSDYEKTASNLIIKPKENNNQFTKIKFLIDWENTQYRTFNNDVRNLFYGWLNTRCAALSLFVNRYRPCNLTLNNNTFHKKYSDIPRSSVHDMTITMRIKNKTELGYNHPIFGETVVYISVVNSNPLQLSIINGIEVLKNPILDIIMDKLFKSIKVEMTSILAKLTTEIKKPKFMKSEFDRYILAMYIGTIMNPQWVGQTKHEISINNDLLNNYVIDYGDVAKELAEVFKEILIGKKSESISKASPTKIKNEKYTECLNIRNRRKNCENNLWLMEGDSAKNFIVDGIGSEKSRFDFDNSGMLTLGGVIINTYNRIHVCDMSNFRYVKNKNKSVLVIDEKCSNNIFIRTFIAACNIKINCAYTTEDELNTLRYKHIIIATDQDKDGWNINGLLLVFLMKWPNLIKLGRVKRLQTPVARLKPVNITAKNFRNSKEFFSELEVDEYLTTNTVPRGYEIKYYKGLGTHEELYRDDIFANIDKYLYTFMYTPKSDGLLKVYYDKTNPELRKQELRTPLRQFNSTEVELYKKKIIAISTFLQVFVKDYQLDNLNRKLLKVMDGQNNVCGKILYVAPYVNASNAVKVTHLGSEVSKRTNYHHGDESMYKTIFKNAQSFPGKKVHPYFSIDSMSGSRIDGGKKYSAPRYSHVKLNNRMYSSVFKREDDVLLEYMRSENCNIEPICQYPVLPMAILDNYKTTAHGWKIEIWARDLDSVIKAMNALINGRTPTNEIAINPNISKSELVVCNDGEKNYLYSKGKYRIETVSSFPELVITELPLGVWNKNYIKDLEESKYFSEKLLLPDVEITDRTVGESVCIRVPLRKDWEANLRKYEDDIFDDYILNFGLRVRLHDELNFIAMDGSVVSFSSYKDFIIYWFEKRKELYILRIKRLIEIRSNEIEIKEAILKYLKNFHEWGLGKRNDEQTVIDILSNNDIVPLNSSLVKPNTHVPTEYIRQFMHITKEGENGLFDELHRKNYITGYASYEYVNSIRNDKVRKASIEPLEIKIDKLKEELAYLKKPNSWRNIWATEIRSLVSILKEAS